jgi:tetratricopeptide (TPR) repeat protein
MARQSKSSIKPGPQRKDLKTGRPRPRHSRHKRRSVWFQARSSWPVREAPVEALVRERARARQTLATPPGKATSPSPIVGAARVLIARAQGNTSKARDALLAARSAIEAKLREQPENALLLSSLGLIDAGLSRKAEAIEEGRRATELRPISNDAVDGATVISALAMIYAWTGENDLAIERLAFLAKTPGGPHYGELKYDPAWDPLRNDPRFQVIVNNLLPESKPEQ